MQVTKMEKEERNIKINPEIIDTIGIDDILRSCIKDHFAESWFNDTQREAQIKNDRHARRREIIFAVCFAETYLFEWVREIVKDSEILNYFPLKPRFGASYRSKPRAKLSPCFGRKRRFKRDPRYRRDLKSNWKELPKELYQEGRISTIPKLDLSGLGQLIRYRNALVHAMVSLPTTDIQSKEETLIPSRKQIERIKPGWALDIVVKLVNELHKENGKSAPGYIPSA